MLEAAFVAWLVALVGDRTVRGAARVLLGDPDRRRLEAALAEASRVAIAALLDSIPSDSREELSNALCERFRLASAPVLDGRSRVRTALINAIRTQIDPLGDRAVTLNEGLLRDQVGDKRIPLADALAHIAIRSIEQLGPRFPVLTPLVVQLNADAAAERGEAVADKVDEILALLERKFQAPAGPIWVGHPDQSFIPDSIDRLVNALLQIPSIVDDTVRNEILKRLPDPLRDAIPRNSIPRIQIYGIVETCGVYAHGLRDLRNIIYSFERDSLPMRQLDDVILGIGATAELRNPPDFKVDPSER